MITGVCFYVQDCVVALLSMLGTTIEHMSKDEVKGHSSLLLNVFTTVLDYRATQVSENFKPNATMESFRCTLSENCFLYHDDLILIRFRLM